MGSDKKNAIVEALEEEDRPLGPKEIAAKTGLNHSTVRSYLRRLVHEGAVCQPYRGNYVANLTSMVGELLPRVHDLVLRVDASGLVRGLGTFVGCYGDVRIEVRFGGKRGCVTGFVSCDRGLDYVGCVLAVEKFKDMVWRRAGLELSDRHIVVRRCHFNQDFQGVRLDGVESLTVYSFLGSLERIYNKGAGLRSEVQVRPNSLETVYAILKQGVSSYNILQGQFMLGRKIDALIEAVKFMNGGLQSLMGLSERRLRKPVEARDGV